MKSLFLILVSICLSINIYAQSNNSENTLNINSINNNDQKTTNFIEIISPVQYSGCLGDSVTLSMNGSLPGIGMYTNSLPSLQLEDTTGISIFDTITPYDDHYYGPFPIGFDFNFFGIIFSEFWVGSNGWISFIPLSSPTNDPCITQQIPNTDPSRPRSAIFAAYRDWDPSISGDIKYRVEDNYPFRKLIISFNSIALGKTCTQTQGSFQIVLYEGTNAIDINLISVPTCLSTNNGNGVCGIQNISATIGYSVPTMNNTPWTATNTTIRYETSHINWYDPNNQFIGAGNPIHLHIDLSGDYYCRFSYNSTLTIPVDSIYLGHAPVDINLPIDTNSCYPITLNLTSPNSFVLNNGNLLQTFLMENSNLYTITISNDHCDSTYSISTFIDPPPDENLQDEVIICVGESEILDADIGVGYNYLWNTGDTTQTIEVIQPDIYIVTITNTLGCSLTDSLNLINYPIPNSNFTFEEAFGTVQFNSMNQLYTLYTWDFGDGSPLVSEPYPVHTYPSLLNNEFYTVTLTSSNICGNESSQFELIIFDIDATDSQIGFKVYPNPTNGKLLVQNNSIKEYQIILRNSLGQVLISKQNIISSEEIDIRDYSDGIYLLEIIIENKSKMYKIVKE